MKNFWIICFGLTGLALVFIEHNCSIKFTKSSIDITSILVSFGTIGLLIERFVNTFIINEKNNMVKKLIRKVSFENGKDKDDLYRLTAALEEHSKAFIKASFGVGLIIAAVGFKFITQISEPTTCTLCHTTLEYSFVFSLMDIFLSAILLSGGSQFIDKIIKALPPKLTLF